MTGVAEPFLLRRVTERRLKGMDITEYVKRNNFAVAQYESKLCCTAQNRLLSRDTRWSPRCEAERDEPFESLAPPSEARIGTSRVAAIALIRESEAVQVRGRHQTSRTISGIGLARKPSPQRLRNAQGYYLPSYL
ncbi:MAG: hypothetical protein ABI471_00745 [Sphingomonas bacterium]